MLRTLFLIFNHELTSAQEADARSSLGVSRIVSLPPELKRLWSDIPPEMDGLTEYLEPFRAWLALESHPGDFALIQGDFGACYLMTLFAFELGLAPIYSTTRREAIDEPQPDGGIKLTHRFQHTKFRKYGV